MSSNQPHGDRWDSTTVIDTDHGVYDALPARDADDAPAATILTVFRDGGSLAGYVAGWAGGRFVAMLASDRGARIIAVRATLAGAAQAVADNDGGYQS
jgi:hypothetical protein